MKSSKECGWRKLGVISLFTISICLLVLGIISLIIGMILNGGTLLNSDIRPVINIITVDSHKLGDQISLVPMLLIAIGVVTIIGAALGLFIAIMAKWRKITLIGYSVLSGVVCLGTIIILALFIPKIQVKENNKEQMLEGLQHNFTDVSIDSTNELSNSWNLMFLNMELDCCGVNPIQGSTNDFDKTPWCTTRGDCQQTNAEIPKTCCVNVTSNTFPTASGDCYSNVKPGTYKPKGCFEVVENRVNAHSPMILGVGVPIIILELLAVILAVILRCKEEFLNPEGASFIEICCSCCKSEQTPSQENEQEMEEQKVPLN